MLLILFFFERNCERDSIHFYDVFMTFLIPHEQEQQHCLIDSFGNQLPM